MTDQSKDPHSIQDWTARIETQTKQLQALADSIDAKFPDLNRAENTMQSLLQDLSQAPLETQRKLIGHIQKMLSALKDLGFAMKNYDPATKRTTDEDL